MKEKFLKINELSLLKKHLKNNNIKFSFMLCLFPLIPKSERTKKKKKIENESLISTYLPVFFYLL